MSVVLDLNFGSQGRSRITFQKCGLAYNNSPLLFVVRPAKSAMAVSLSTDWVLTLHIDTHLLKETGDHLLPHVRTTMMTTMTMVTIVKTIIRNVIATVTRNNGPCINDVIKI